MSMPKLNDYELLEIIGNGSYSVVHRAKHKVRNFHKTNEVISHARLSFVAGDEIILCDKMCGKGKSVENFHRQLNP